MKDRTANVSSCRVARGTSCRLFQSSSHCWFPISLDQPSHRKINTSVAVMSKVRRTHARSTSIVETISNIHAGTPRSSRIVVVAGEWTCPNPTYPKRHITEDMPASLIKSQALQARCLLPPVERKSRRSLQPANRKCIVSPAAAMPFKKGHKGHPRKSLGSESRLFLPPCRLDQYSHSRRKSRTRDQRRWIRRGNDR